MKFDAARLQANTSLFGQDGQHRYWWRTDFEAGGFRGDQLDRILWVFLCPMDGPTTAAHLAAMRGWCQALGARNMGAVSLLNSMAAPGDVMRQPDPVGPHANAALRAALDWCRNRPRRVLPSGRVMLVTGTPAWTFEGHVKLLAERNAYLWAQLRKRDMRASRLGPQDCNGWTLNPLADGKAHAVASSLGLAMPNDGGPLPRLEATASGMGALRPGASLEQK